MTIQELANKWCENNPIYNGEEFFEFTLPKLEALIKEVLGEPVCLVQDPETLDCVQAYSPRVKL